MVKISGSLVNVSRMMHGLFVLCGNSVRLIYVMRIKINPPYDNDHKKDSVHLKKAAAKG